MRRHILLTKTLASTQNHADHQSGYPGINMNYGATGKVYRWVDENGVVHYGDAIPPEYSKERHEVLDGRGTRVTVHGEKPESESPARDNRDRALLATYGSVAEIEAVRARRQALADNPAAINELATVEQRIREYDYEISRRNAEIERIREQFAGDILRFEELRGAENAPEGVDEAAAARSAEAPPER